jgi:hypothetical protein
MRRREHASRATVDANRQLDFGPDAKYGIVRT